MCPLRLASHVRQSRVASADPHEQAPLSAARPSVPCSMKQCSRDRPRDSPFLSHSSPSASHPPASLDPHAGMPASRSPLSPHLPPHRPSPSQARRLVCARLFHDQHHSRCTTTTTTAITPRPSHHGHVHRGASQPSHTASPLPILPPSHPTQPPLGHSAHGGLRHTRTNHPINSYPCLIGMIR